MVVVIVAFGLLNICQVLTLPLYLFSESLFHRTLFWLAEKCSDTCVWWMHHVLKMKPVVEADPLPAGENVVLICNHQSFSDVVITMYLASLYRRVGHLKFFVKDSIKYLPGPGWGLQFNGSIFLKRNWESDIKSLSKAFAHIRDKKLPFWLVSFPEGTRATPAKIAASQNYMRSMGLVPLKHRLCPRSKGFTATLQQLGNKIDAIYDVTIDYRTPKPPNLWNFVSGLPPYFSLKIKRYPYSQIPTTPEGQKIWLIERFREKDHV